MDGMTFSVSVVRRFVGLSERPLTIKVMFCGT
jgi:hypothetical protein